MTADRDAIIGLLEQLLDETVRQRQLLEAMVAHSGPTLYCPPDLPWCPGGVLLMPSTVKSDKLTPEQQRDRFYHPLPEDKWHDVPGEAGSTFFAKNHPVWRSEAIQGPAIDPDYPPFLDDDAPAARPAGRGEAAPRAAAGPPRSATTAPPRAAGPPVEPRIGQWLTDVFARLRMNGTDVREAGGFARNCAAAELLDYDGGLAELYRTCEQWAIAKGRVDVGIAGAK